MSAEEMAVGVLPDEPEDDGPGGELEIQLPALPPEPRRRWSLRKRAADTEDVEPAEDIDDVPEDDPEVYASVEMAEYVEPNPWEVSPLRGPLERFASRPLPTVLTLRMSAKWWGRHLLIALGHLVMRSPLLVLYQVAPITRGLAKWAGTYSTWRAQTEWLAAVREAEGKDKAKKFAEVKARQRAHTRLSIVLVLLVLGGALVAWLMGYGLAVIAGVILLLAVADAAGRREKPVDHGIEIMPRSNFQEGAPVAMVIADIRAVLVEHGHDTERLAVTTPRVGEYGVAVAVHSPRAIGEGEVTAIERGLQTYRGAVSIVGQPGNAAVSEVRVMWRDPLAKSFVPERVPPLSRSVAQAAEVGYGLGRVPLLLMLMRVNVLIVGAPGSGKSSAFWALIDWLSTCRDVVLHGIDLSGGPALRVWGDVFETRATTRDEAKALLEQNIARAHERTEVLAERSEPRPGRPAPQSENWTPEDAEAGRGLFHITFIDELPLLAADDELRDLYAEHQRIGRKAGDTSIAATQDLSGDTLGATSLRKYPSTLVMMACSREDVTSAMGGGKIAEGWTPHRFVAAEGEDANDAGKCMIKSGRHNAPNPWRFSRLDDISEIHSRAIERIEAGRPCDDAPISVAAVVPEPLASVAAVFRAAGTPEFLPTDDVLEGLEKLGKATTDRKLSAGLKAAHGFGPGRKRIDGEPARGYAWADVSTAMDEL